MCIPRATVSAVSCLVVPAFICIDLLISLVLKINDDDDERVPEVHRVFQVVYTIQGVLGGIPDSPWCTMCSSCIRGVPGGIHYMV